MLCLLQMRLLRSEVRAKEVQCTKPHVKQKRKDITFRDLLSHRSGLPAWTMLMTEKDADAARAKVLGLSLAYPPRTRVVYSCMNFLLLAMSAERITGQTLEQLIKDRVLSVLDLQATMYQPLNKGITL